MLDWGDRNLSMVRGANAYPGKSSHTRRCGIAAVLALEPNGWLKWTTVILSGTDPESSSIILLTDCVTPLDL